MFVMEKALMLIMVALGVTTTLTTGILMTVGTIGTAQAIGCHHFNNQGADCIDGFLCVHHFDPDKCRQTGPP
jgi:hypothetical protein